MLWCIPNHRIDHGRTCVASKIVMEAVLVLEAVMKAAGCLVVDVSLSLARRGSMCMCLTVVGQSRGFLCLVGSRT